MSLEDFQLLDNEPLIIVSLKEILQKYTIVKEIN